MSPPRRDRPLIRPHRSLVTAGSLLLACAVAAADTGSPESTVPEIVAVRHRVDLGGNRFVPRLLRIAAGDTVDFINGAGGPHNVAFWADSLPRDTRATIGRLMPDSIAPLTGSLLFEEEQAWTMVFEGVPPGRYPYYCLPHVAGGMVGEVQVGGDSVRRET